MKAQGIEVTSTQVCLAGLLHVDQSEGNLKQKCFAGHQIEDLNQAVCVYSLLFLYGQKNLSMTV